MPINDKKLKFMVKSVNIYTSSMLVTVYVGDNFEMIATDLKNISVADMSYKDNGSW